MAKSPSSAIRCNAASSKPLTSVDAAPRTSRAGLLALLLPGPVGKGCLEFYERSLSVALNRIAGCGDRGADQRRNELILDGSEHRCAGMSPVSRALLQAGDCGHEVGDLRCNAVRADERCEAVKRASARTVSPLRLIPACGCANVWRMPILDLTAMRPVAAATGVFRVIRACPRSGAARDAIPRPSRFRSSGGVPQTPQGAFARAPAPPYGRRAGPDAGRSYAEEQPRHGSLSLDRHSRRSSLWLERGRNKKPCCGD